MKSSALKILSVLCFVMVTAASVQILFPTEPEADAGDDLRVIVGEPVNFDGIVPISTAINSFKNHI